MAKNIKVKKGFTIIEVVLVLAIAGLIFLMVFVAFPALQRSQKDTQRQNDISRLSTQINNFKTNNTGGIPGNAAKNDGLTSKVTGRYEKKTGTEAAKIGTWAYFYDNYMLAGNDTFQDPDGDPYGLEVVWCNKSGTAAKPMGTTAVGTACPNTEAQRTATEFSTQSRNGHNILIVLGAGCDGETAIAATGARNMALIYKREGGGVICIAN